MSIRCLNCGFINPDGAQVCQNCGAPLGSLAEPQGGVSSNQQGSKQDMPNFGLADREISSTRMESFCPYCGYPLPADAEVCPHCGKRIKGYSNEDKQVSSGAVNEEQYEGIGNIQNPKLVGGCPPPSISTVGTVMPGQFEGFGETKSIELLELDKSFNETGHKSHFSIAYSGSSEVIKRDNLDPSNNTISRREHAYLCLKDGQIFIQDKSSNHMTFVLASRPIAINDGDIVLIGNKIYKIKIK